MVCVMVRRHGYPDEIDPEQPMQNDTHKEKEALICLVLVLSLGS